MTDTQSLLADPTSPLVDRMLVAICLVDNGSRTGEVISQESKGTGNREIVLTQELFEPHIFPCVHLVSSGTR